MKQVIVLPRFLIALNGVEIDPEKAGGELVHDTWIFNTQSLIEYLRNFDNSEQIKAGSRLSNSIKNDVNVMVSIPCIYFQNSDSKK